MCVVMKKNCLENFWNKEEGLDVVSFNYMYITMVSLCVFWSACHLHCTYILSRPQQFHYQFLFYF